MSLEKQVVDHECSLLNRHELSNSQRSELQRFIDLNSHLLQSPYSPGSETHKRPEQQFQSTVSTVSPRSKKGVKWFDSLNSPVQRTRSLSPKRNYNNSRSSNQMAHYGGSEYLNLDRNANLYGQSMSPVYQGGGRHQDEYNSYNSTRSRSRMSAQLLDSDRCRFSGYGDRPGSGVEFIPSKWRGGEIVTDPLQLPPSLKPRRLYYSPIGDGVVAADGVEMKPALKDLSQRVTVQHVRTLDRGEPGQDGYNLYSRDVTGSDYGSDLAGSGRDSRLTGGFSPGSDSYAHGGGGGGGGGGPGMSYGGGNGREPDYRCGSGGSGGAIPLGYDGKGEYSPRNHDRNKNGFDAYGGGAPTNLNTNLSNYGAAQCNVGMPRPSQFGNDGTGRAQSTGPYNDQFDNYGGHHGTHTDGRSSAGSHYSQKFDVDTDYMITNPRELIHQYATTTPVAVLDVPETTSRTVKKMYSSTTEETYAPYPPYKGKETSIHPKNFARQIRDDGLTVSQREANLHQASLINKSDQGNQRLHDIHVKTTTRAPSVKDIDYLTEKMVYDLQSTRIAPSNY